MSNEIVLSSLRETLILLGIFAVLIYNMCATNRNYQLPKLAIDCNFTEPPKLIRSVSNFCLSQNRSCSLQAGWFRRFCF